MTRSPIRVLVAVLVTVATALVVVPNPAGASPATPPAARPSPSSATARYRTDRLLVKFKPGVSAQQQARSLHGARARTVARGSDVQTVSVPNGDVMGVIAHLKADPSVTLAQPDYLYHATETIPNDPYYAQQWGPAKIAAPESWDVARGSAASNAPVVAVIDSGVDYVHPDLATNMWTNPGGIGSCRAGTHGYDALAQEAGSPYYGLDPCIPFDDDGHGTHVSGIIGAAGNNGTGVSGVEWQARIMAVKFLDSSGSGDDVAAIAAINWVVDAKNHGVNVRVINASWGGSGDDTALDNAIQSANAAGILFVAAAGNGDNSGTPIDVDTTPQYPCSTSGVLCVASSDPYDGLSWFSNYGASTVALAAPGECILSTVPTEFPFGENDPYCGTPPRNYAYLDGTSMATPFVSGTAALIAAAAPSADATQLRADMVNSVDPSSSLSSKVSSGGRLDVCKALAQAGVFTPPQSLRATQSNGSALIAWNAPCSGATDYAISQSGGGSTTTASSTTTLSSLTTNAAYTVTVTARMSGSPRASSTVLVTPLSGGYELDGFGGLHPVAASGGTAPPTTSGGPYWRTWNIARGVAVLPSGAGGYVLDGYGGLHPFGVGTQTPPPGARVSGYWPGWDIARGVAFLPDGTGGYVVDGYGGLHPFAVGNAPMPPNLSTPNYWPGWDIVRGIATVPSGSLSLTSAGGLVLDGYGGIHGFSLGGATPSASNGPYWKPWDIARGITVSHDGTGGYVGDGWGGVHPFQLTQPAPPLQTGQYWQGWDISRGLAL